MPSIDAVRSALPGLASQIPKQATIVVCGGTSGIGEAMARKLALLAEKPDVHLVGRNAVAANAIIADLKRAKPEGSYSFHA
jgi:NAD(P)-dependent dehydrogenase (short-subunit alcohol dehydrogenase family)